MAVTQWLKLALGSPYPKRYRFPKPPPVILLAPTVRAAQLWAYENGQHPRDFYIVVHARYGADRLRGIGPGRDLIWVHGPPWDHRDIDALEQRVAWIRASVGLNSERHVYV